ncbi:hypothetical protein [Streptomyces sp. NPDC058371]|jgi:hypothetical protein|uniref:hypothetical protein n=1 Tax=Streptomyces sp. NPDC058371 TaxID=3346463 RepID=UPI00365CA08A
MGAFLVRGTIKSRSLSHASPQEINGTQQRFSHCVGVEVRDEEIATFPAGAEGFSDAELAAVTALLKQR